MSYARPHIRQTLATDYDALTALYLQAFPDEDLLPVVSALLSQTKVVLSLAAFDGPTLAGHVLFTLGHTDDPTQIGALLAPLGVLPSFQGQGIGSRLVRAGFEQLERQGVRQVFVLGDPAYYQHFGFAPERRILTPCSIPDEWADAWQSVRLADRAALSAGPLRLPSPWMDPSLWAP